jgi:hypothetical protein
MVSASEKLRELRKGLKEQKAVVDDIESEIYRLQKLAIREAVDAKVDEFVRSQIDYPSGLNRIFIRDLLCWEKKSEYIGLEDQNITLHGNGPWAEDELGDFLIEKDFSLTSIDNLPSILVLGDIDIEKEVVHSYISYCLDSSKIPKIYTQELFIYWFICGEDPLDTLQNQTLIDLVENHGGMEVVFEYQGLKWPELSIDFSEDSTITEFEFDDLGNQSILFKLGYNAKQGDLSTHERRSILKDAYESSLSNVIESSEDRVRWGSAKSSQRLYAISKFLSWLLNFQGKSKPAAAEKWGSDLNWLKDNFYTKQKAFKWPSQYSSVESKRARREIADPWRLKIGKRVFQEKYGWGKVTKIENRSGRHQISIQFDNGGPERTFDSEIAKLLA